MSTVNGFQVGSETLKYNYESLENYNTPEFSSSSTYAVGDYVIYQGKLYKCISAVSTAGSWNSSNWILAVLSDDVSDLKNVISQLDGGVAGQLLRKHSNADDDFEWGYVYITPQMFGAIGDGTTDDTTALQNAINYAVQNSMLIVFANGTFLVNSTITIPDRTHLLMYSSAKIMAGSNVEYVVTIDATTYLTQQLMIRGLTVDGNNIAQNGVKIYMISINRSVAIQGLYVRNCVNDGVIFDNSQGGQFESILSTNNGGTGVIIRGCNDSKFIGVSSSQNANGCMITNISGASGGCYIYGLHCEDNSGTGLTVDGTGMTSINSGWLEGNRTLPLLIDNNAHVLISGFRIIAYQQQTTPMVVNSNFAIIRDTELGAANPDFYNIVLNGDSVLENISSSNTNLRSVIQPKVGSELITNADCQGTGGFVAHAFTTITYQSQEQVATGKTYSIKMVASQAGAYMDQALTSLSGKYRVSGKIYSDDIDNVRIIITRTSASAVSVPNYEKSKWIEFEIYCNFDTNISIGLDARSSGTLYVGDFSVKSYEDGKISTKRIGNNYIYADVIKPVTNV